MSDPFTAPADPFMDGAGNAAAFKFNAIGDEIVGVVTAVKEQNDTKPDGTPVYWPSGDPKKVYVFTLDTDAGEQALWVRGNMVKAVREAVTTAGLNTVLGAKLTIKHHALGDVVTKGHNPAKLFKAKAEPAPARAAAGGPLPAGEEPW
jgi:hypothetical protein